MNIIEKFNIDTEKVLKNLKKVDGTPFFGTKDIIKRKGGKEFSICCPFHNDASPSMWVSVEKNAYNCFVCRERIGESKFIPKNKSIGRGTFIVQFLKVFYGEIYGRNITLDEIAGLCSIGESEKNTFSLWIQKGNTFEKGNEKVVEKEEKYPISLLNVYLGGDYSYILKRLNQKNDLTPARLKETIKYFYLWINPTNKDLVIPIFENFYLKGLYARVVNPKVDQKNRYYNIKSFKKTSIVFNLDNIKDQEELILVEGPLNVMRLWALWYTNVVSLFGSNIFFEQAQKLKKFKKIKVWFDGDTWGEEWRKLLKKQLGTTIIEEIITEWKVDAYDLERKEIETLLWPIC